MTTAQATAVIDTLRDVSPIPEQKARTSKAAAEDEVSVHLEESGIASMYSDATTQDTDQVYLPIRSGVPHAAKRFLLC
jgi:hypothetical protein